MPATQQAISGHVFLRDGARGGVWYAKYRAPDGRQIKRKIGPGWSGRTRAPADHYTKRAAEQWLRDHLDEVRRGTVPESIRTGATFADAAAEWIRYSEHERACKPATIKDYRNVARILGEHFGDAPLERIGTDEIERWKAT